MIRILLLALAILALTCKVEKTGKDTYKVVAPTPEAKAAGEKAKEQVKAVGKEVKEETAKGAEKVGGALKKAGEKIEQKTETTATTSTKTKKHSQTTTRY